MDRPQLLAIVLAFLALLLLLMVLGWRARQRRQADLPHPPAVPADVGQRYGAFDGFYVATTTAGEPLNRIAVRGLGYRARASVTVADAGIVLSLRGEDDAFVPVSSLREVTTATWTIDRVVESGGLVLLGWTLGTTPVDSYFRLPDSQPLLDAIAHIFPPTTGRTA